MTAASHNMSTEKIVTIFGGSKCLESDAEYADARRVGQLLADAGYTICTGGYSGVMEAASRGAHERGGRVIGITIPLVLVFAALLTARAGPRGDNRGQRLRARR